MDDFFKKTKCDRCHGDFNGCRTMSMLNTQVICMVDLVEKRIVTDQLTLNIAYDVLNLTDPEQFGKNAVLKAMSLQEGATAKDRNQQVGGHKA